MRRLHALLIAVGLAAAPSSAVAGPFNNALNHAAHSFERFDGKRAKVDAVHCATHGVERSPD